MADRTKLPQITPYRCRSCRHAVPWSYPDSMAGPGDGGLDCAFEDDEVMLPHLERLQGEADETGDLGDTADCQLWESFEICRSHGLPIRPGADYGCSACEAQGWAAEEAARAAEHNEVDHG